MLHFIVHAHANNILLVLRRALLIYGIFTAVDVSSVKRSGFASQTFNNHLIQELVNDLKILLCLRFSIPGNENSSEEFFSPAVGAFFCGCWF